MSFPKVKELFNEKDCVHQQPPPWVTLEIDNSMTGSGIAALSLRGVKRQDDAESKNMACAVRETGFKLYLLHLIMK